MIPITAIDLLPASHGLTFSYSASLSNGQSLPSELLTFDDENLFFSVRSSDPLMAGYYQIKVDVTSDDSVWLNQTIAASFTLSTEAVAVASENYEISMNVTGGESEP